MRVPDLHKFRQLLASKRTNPRRRGAIIVLAAILLIAMLGMLAMSVDTGYMYTMQTQLDRAVDAAALAGAGSLVDGTNVAQEKVVEYLVRNPVGKSNTIANDQELAAMRALFLQEHANDYQVLWGHWNADTGQLEQTSQLPSAIEVTMNYPSLPLFFARALGKNSFDLQAHAIAMYQPRDIMVVLDFSGSMNDDSEYKSIYEFGQTVIMEGLAAMYTELGAPIYGNMQFDPQHITVEGAVPASPSMPKITVEYRYKSVYVTSTKDLSNVVVRYSDNSVQKYDGLAGLTGTFGNGKVIERVWVKSGSNDSGEGPGYGEPFDFDASTIRATIKTALGLDSVAYPYASGSWNSFIDYCRNDGHVKNAGFQYMFGYANLINYWLEKKPSHHQTSDLWKVSAQPVTAVKDAVDVFMDYITTVDTNDRLGLVVYNSSSGDAQLETGLTTNLSLVATITRQRQAGHYHVYTNIGAGMRRARLELEANGRLGAFKMIVLMTDGRANWNAGRYSTSAARSDVLSEANAAKALNIPVVAISLGAGADISLMDQVAATTDSRHFNIPGGQSVVDYRDALFNVFRAIADSRPLKLVQ